MKTLIGKTVVILVITILFSISALTIPIFSVSSHGGDKVYAAPLIQWSIGNNCDAIMDPDTGIMTITAAGDSPSIGSYNDADDWPWEAETGNIRKVIFADHVSTSGPLIGMFDKMNNLEEIVNLNFLDTAEATDMSSMFAYCYDLTNIDLSGFDTGKVTNMSNMFRGCNSLTSLDLSTFDTSEITGLQQTFDSCSSLTNIQFPSDIDTSKVVSMKGTFANCSALESLDLSGFSSTSSTMMDNMFDACTSLTELTLGSEFTFGSGSNKYPPSPTGTAVTGFYTGMWVDNNGVTFASDEIPSDVASTYNAEILPVSVNITYSSLYVDSALNAVIENDNGKTFTYQWSRGDSLNGPFTDINGATTNEHILTDDDVGKYLRCTVNYENIVASDITGPILAKAVPVQPASNTTDNTNNDATSGNDNKEGSESKTVDASDLITAVILLIITAIASILSLRLKTRKNL